MAKKWMTTPMAQLWAKERAKGDHAETVKEEHARYVPFHSIPFHARYVKIY